jgi:hypothetical protein
MELPGRVLKCGRLGREEMFRHIKIYRPIKEEP